MKRSRALLLIIYMVAACPLLAQKDSSKLISVELSGAGIEELVLAIEKQTSLHFYYDATQFDSLRFDISEKNQPVTKVLERALEEKGF
jgi:hypothetical protein